MEEIDGPQTGSIFSFDVFISLVLLVVTLLSFKTTIGEAFSGEEEERLAPIKFFMLAMCCISFLVLIIYGARINRDNLFLWIAVFYVFAAMFSTFFSGLYITSALPFKFIRLSYWAWVMIISYYAALHLKTLKYYVVIVILLLPVLFYFFLVSMRTGRDWEGSSLALNPVFYLSFLMPVVLLLRSKILKIAGVLLMFAAVLISYKRSAMISLVTAIPVYFYARITLGNSAKHKRLIPVLLGGAFLLLLLVFSFYYISSVFDLDWTARLEGLTTDRGSGRLDRYLGYLGLMGSQSPYQWIMGNGYYATEYTPYGYAHNDIIEVLYSFGLVGLTLYLLFVGQLAKIFFEMKKTQYKHFDAFAVSLVIFFWGTMFSMLIIIPYWFLNLAFFWGWVIADFHNAKRYGDPEKIGNPLYHYAAYDHECQYEYENDGGHENMSLNEVEEL